MKEVDMTMYSMVLSAASAHSTKLLNPYSRFRLILLYHRTAWLGLRNQGPLGEALSVPRCPSAAGCNRPAD